MRNLCSLNLKDYLYQVRKGNLQPQDVWQACWQQRGKNKNLNAFLRFNDLGVKRARLAAIKNLPLAGAPMAVKDNLSTRQLITTAGSQMLANYHPPYTATVVQRLERAGAIILGKTNCDPFAFGASGENSGFGPTRNPHNFERVPGGSSSGSAAAVAAQMALFALGTDTGGSIRQPAAFCGIVGLKPTYGRCSRWGLLAMGSSFDVPGPLTKTVADAALVLSFMAGYDPRDATSSRRPHPDYQAFLNGEIKNLRVGLIKEFFQHKLQPEVMMAIKRAVRFIEAHGGKIVEVSFPHLDAALAVYYILVPAEISSNMARYDGIRFGHQAKRGKTALARSAFSRGEGFELEVKRRILVGTYILSAGYFDAYYLQASKVRRLIVNDFQQLFKKVDVLLTPTTPTTAFRLGEKISDPVSMYLADIFTVPASVAGLPAISVPFGQDKEKLPIGLQIIGNYFREGTILNTAYFLENVANA